MRLLPLLRWFAVALGAAIVVAQAYVMLHPTPRAVITGTASVGAPFSLTTPDGRPLTDVDLRGNPVVIFFGWTHDPAITPAAMQVLDAATARLEPKNETIRRVFITVDASRDDGVKLEAFSKRYRGGLIVLTGAPEAITALTRAYRLPIERVPDTLLPGGYSLDLPAVYYVLGKDGRFRGVTPYTTDATALAGELGTLVGK